MIQVFEETHKKIKEIAAKRKQPVRQYMKELAESEEKKLESKKQTLLKGEKMRFEKYEVTLAFPLGELSVEVEVKEGAYEREIEFAAEAEVQSQLNYCKLSEYKKL